MTTLIEKAQKIESEGVFLGGAPELFEPAGQKLLMTLLANGLHPYSRVLDVGCGWLRGGYWLIHFLAEERYFGIEPNTEMLDSGIRNLLEAETREIKRPSFDNNAEFDFEVFDQQFDFIVARSIWTHISRDQIRTMLDGFVRTATSDGRFLTSIIKTRPFEKGYLGKEWIGRSHESDQPGIAHHSLKWIQQECSKRGLQVKEVKNASLNFGNQTWLSIRRLIT